MQKVKILEAVKIINDTVKKFDGIRSFLSTGDLDVTVIKSLEEVTYFDKPSRANQNVKKDDIILARMQGTVKVKIIDSDEDNIIVSTGFMVLRCNEGVNNRYIFHYLKSSLFQSKKDKLCSGATQKAINNNKFAEIRIPLPQLPTQQKIAAILDKADELRQYNKQLIEKYEALTQSLFLEMFGDIVSNTKEWDKKTLKEISLRFSDGPFGSNLKTEHYSESGIQVIRLQNIGINKFNDKENDKSFVNENHYNNVLKKYSCYPNDIVIATMGNPNIRACIVPDHISVAVNKADCVLLRVNSNIANQIYISSLLNLEAFLNLAISFIHGQTRSRISSGQLGSILIPIPPIDLQNQFAERVLLIETQKQQAQEALAKSEELFQSLLQRAFKGELN